MDTLLIAKLKKLGLSDQVIAQIISAGGGGGATPQISIPSSSGSSGPNYPQVRFSGMPSLDMPALHIPDPASAIPPASGGGGGGGLFNALAAHFSYPDGGSTSQFTSPSTPEGTVDVGMPETAQATGPYGDEINATASKYNLPAPILSAMIQQESGFNTKAVGDNGNSVGLGQFNVHGALADFGLTKQQYLNMPPAGQIDLMGRFLRQKIDANNGDLWAGVKDYNGGGDPNYLANVRSHLKVGPDVRTASTDAGFDVPTGNPVTGRMDSFGGPTLSPPPEESALARFVNSPIGALLIGGASSNSVLGGLNQLAQSQAEEHRRAQMAYQLARGDRGLAELIMYDPALGLRAYMSQVAARGKKPTAAPTIKEVTIGDKKATVQWNPDTQNWEQMSIGGEPAAGPRWAPQQQDQAGGTKLTEGERKVFGYYDRMQAAETNLSQLEGSAPQEAGNLFHQLWAQYGPNWTQTPISQEYRNAAQDWIRAKLRKESGAVIGEKEMADEYATYFPVFGDSKEVIQQKQIRRAIAMDAMKKESGRAPDSMSTTPWPGSKPASQSGLPSIQDIDAELRKRGVIQ